MYNNTYIQYTNYKYTLIFKIIPTCNTINETRAPNISYINHLKIKNYLKMISFTETNWFCRNAL